MLRANLPLVFASLGWRGVTNGKLWVGSGMEPGCMDAMSTCESGNPLYYGMDAMVDREGEQAAGHRPGALGLEDGVLCSTDIWRVQAS